MAITNLTGFNPFEIDQSKNFRAAESAGKAIGSGIEGFGDEIKEKAARRRKADEDRKQKADENHKDLLAREQKIETETFGEFNQVKSKQSGPIANELNVLAQNDKAAFIDLSTKLQDPNVGKEERANIREQMGIIGGRAKNIAGGLTKLQENADAWNEIAITEGISNATPPALRSMMMDFANRENQENYHVDIDEDGRERLSGITTDGDEVSYYLEDIANGANTFRAIPKKNKAKMLDDLAKEIPKEVKQYTNEYGLAQSNNSDLMGQKAAELIMDTLEGEENYRGLAAEYGFGYDDLKALEEGQGFPIEAGLSEEELAKIDKDGDGYIRDQDELKGYLANRMLHDLSDRIPTDFKQVNYDIYDQQKENSPGAQTQTASIKTAEYKADQAKKQYEDAKSYLRPFRGAGGAFITPKNKAEAKQFERAFGSTLPIGYTSEYKQSSSLFGDRDDAGTMTIFDKSGNVVQELDPSDTQGVNNFLSKILGGGIIESEEGSPDDFSDIETILNN